MTGIGARAAYVAWTEHRYFAYRGCAPDVDDPRRAAGDPSLSLDAWHGEDRDGGEPQRVRRAREAAALEVCLSCPVMVQCDRYANSVVTDDGGVARLAEPDGIRGGRTALERHRTFVAHRHEVAAAAPDGRLRTKQKLAVLRALAQFWDPYDVAGWAGMDVRTANWQRSVLVTLLNLNKASATRMELLAEAVRRGLLDAGVVRDDDGSVPAVPPSAGVPRGSVPEPAAVGVAVPAGAARRGVADGTPRESAPQAAPERAVPPAPRADPVPYEPVRVPSPRRDRFTDVAGQLALWEAELTELAPVHSLFPAERLEAAA